MRKITLLFALVQVFFAQAQEKKITFSKELHYDFINKKKQAAPDMSAKSLGNTNGEFLLLGNFNTVPVHFFTDNLGTSSVNITLNNKLTNSGFTDRMFSYQNYGESKKPIMVKKLNVRETILGIPCEQFILSTINPEDEHEDFRKRDIKVCINENHEINNANVLSGLLNLLGGLKLKNDELKGLVLKAGPEAEYDQDHVVLKSIKESKDFVYFNHRDAMMKQQRLYDSIALERKKWETEYENYAVDSAVALVDSAAAPIDADFYDEDYYIEEYVSNYRNKKKKTEEENLAIDNMMSEKLWVGLPKHCRKIEDNLPNLDNKEFKKHLQNYVGQMCDMYLTQSSNHNVGIKITLDEIRKEVLYMNENKGKLSKPDQKKLDKYLENLD